MTRGHVSVMSKPFTPLSASPSLWLDASDTSTITSSSGAVSQWNDKSSNGFHVSQATGASQPTTGTSTINGLNVLNFNNVQLLARAATQIRSFSWNNADVMLFAVGSPGATPWQWTPFAITNNDGSNRVSFQWRSSLWSNNWYLDLGNVSTARLNSQSLWPTDEVRIVSTFRNGGNQRAFYNATSMGSLTTASGSLSSESLTLQVGRVGTDSQERNGLIGEIIVVPYYSAQIFVLLQDYLRKKWAVY